MKRIIGSENQRELVQQDIDRLDLSGGRSYVVEVTPRGKPVSSKQRALYRIWCAKIADFTGDNAEDIHETLMTMFLPPVEREIRGRVILDRSTEDLETETMSCYMARVQAWAASYLGVILE